MVRRGDCLKQVVREGLSKERTLGGELENEEEKGHSGAGEITGDDSGGLCSQQWIPIAHHFYGFQVFFTVNICFQDGMNITSEPPTSYFLSAACTGAILSRDYRDSFFE